MAHRISNKSIMVAAPSTVVEWYDFTPYLYFATVLSRVFFGGGEASAARGFAGDDALADARADRPGGGVAAVRLALRDGFSVGGE